jgi:hypothetical protein
MVVIPPDMQECLPRGGRQFPWKHHYEIFRNILREIVEEQQPMTVRQVFYRAVVKGYVEKTERGYGFIQRDLAQMRRDGRMPFEWIIDSSRNARSSQGYNHDLEEWLEIQTEDLPDTVAGWWSRDLLADHEFSIQVWLEKEALSEVIWGTCQRWGVPLYPARGYASLTFINDAAKDLESKDRPAKIFHLGDYDPSGQNAIESVQYDLRGMARKTAKHGLEFKIVAVTPQQIQEMNLPTRPTKKTDTRSGGFSDESVELDAIEPEVLRTLVNETLAGCFPEGALEENARRQEQERELIRERIRAMLG